MPDPTPPPSEPAQKRPPVEIYRYALELIAERPTTERNPDGDEQAAYSMQLIAREALEAAPAHSEGTDQQPRATKADFDEAKRLMAEGDTEGLAAFASRNVDQRAREAAQAAEGTDQQRPEQKREALAAEFTQSADAIERDYAGEQPPQEVIALVAAYRRTASALTAPVPEPTDPVGEERREYDELFRAYEFLLPEPLDYRTATLAQKALNLARRSLSKLSEAEARAEWLDQHAKEQEARAKTAEARNVAPSAG